MDGFSGRTVVKKHEEWLNSHLDDEALVQRLKSILVADPKRIDKQKQFLRRLLGE